MERRAGIEPATPCLEGRSSAAELSSHELGGQAFLSRPSAWGTDAVRRAALPSLPVRGPLLSLAVRLLDVTNKAVVPQSTFGVLCYHATKVGGCFVGTVALGIRGQGQTKLHGFSGRSQWRRWPDRLVAAARQQQAQEAHTR